LLQSSFIVTELTDFKGRRIAHFRKNLVDLAELELKHAKVSHYSFNMRLGFDHRVMLAGAGTAAEAGDLQPEGRGVNGLTSSQLPSIQFPPASFQMLYYAIDYYCNPWLQIELCRVLTGSVNSREWRYPVLLMLLIPSLHFSATMF
jgi:hypothetical protein